MTPCWVSGTNVIGADRTPGAEASEGHTPHASIISDSHPPPPPLLIGTFDDIGPTHCLRLRALNLITAAKSHLPCKVTYGFQGLGWGRLWGPSFSRTWELLGL